MLAISVNAVSSRAWALGVLLCLNYRNVLDNYRSRGYNVRVLLGSHIGQYKIVRKIGAGGMGLVFLGEHTLLGRRAAIKTLLPTLSVNREIAERFFNEARATSAITDPGVIQIFDFGYHVDGTAYIVMELLEGEALSARIERLGRLPVAAALRIARQGAVSLSSAHAHNIVHRDLKPENIFIVHDGEAQGGERTKILDFGICKLGGDAGVTESGAMIGTPVYMSPEQCRASSEVDHRSDIYAFGCLMFHMLTGRPPFEGNTSGELIVAHLGDLPPLASSLVPELPPEIDALVARCLAKDPSERFQSMIELQAAIGEIATRVPVTDTSTPTATPALLLGSGFQSVYNGSLGGSPAPLGSPPPMVESAGSKTADLKGRARFTTKTPITDDDYDDLPQRSRSGLRAVLTISLVAGLIGGLIATSVLLGNDDASASSKSASAATTAPARDEVSEPAPAAITVTTPAIPDRAPAPAPAAIAVTAPTIVPAEVRSTDIAPKMSQRAAAPAPRVVSSRTLTVKKQLAVPRPRPATRKTKAPSPSSSVEDLYDTR